MMKLFVKERQAKVIETLRNIRKIPCAFLYNDGAAEIHWLSEAEVDLWSNKARVVKRGYDSGCKLKDVIFYGMD